MFIYFYPPYVALCASKAWQRFGSEKLSWCLETFLFLRLSSRDGNPSLPLLSLFLSFILFPTYFPRVGFFSGCLMSSGSIHKLYCGIYSTFKCSFDDFVGEKVFSPSYSSAILAPPLCLVFSNIFFNKCVRIFLYFNYMIINLKLNSYLKSFHDSSFSDQADLLLSVVTRNVNSVWPWTRYS